MVTTREDLLFRLVCHFATLAQWEMNGQSGALASAGQGDVSASYAQAQVRKGDEFYGQTLCGQTYLALIKQYRRGGIYVRNKKWVTLG